MKFLGFLIILFTTINDYAQKTELIVQTGHSASINDIQFSPDENFILSCGDDKRIIVWDRKTQSQFGVLTGHTDVVTSLCFVPFNDSLVYSSSMDGRVICWNFINCNMVETYELGGPVANLLYNDVTNQFIFSSYGVYTSSLNFFNIKHHNVNEVAGDFSMGKSILESIATNNNGSRIAFADGNSVCGVIDKNNLDLNTVVARKHIKKVAFAENDRLLYILHGNGRLTLDNFETYRIRNQKSVRNHFNISTFHNGKKFFAGTNSGHLLEMTPKSLIIKNRYKIHKGKVRKITLNKDNSKVLSVDENGEIYVTDLATKKVVEKYEAKINRIDDITFSEDGKMVFAAFRNGEIRGFNLEDFSSISFDKFTNKKQDKRVQYKIVDIVNIENNQLKIKLIKYRYSTELQWMYDYIKEYEVIWNYEDDKIISEKRINPSVYSEEYFKRENIRNVINYGYQNDFFAHNLTTRFDNQTANVSNGIIIFENNLNTVELQHSDIVTSMVYNTSGDFLATASWDGSIQFWDYQKGTLKLQLYLMGDNQFTFITKDNEYFSSKEGMKNIKFKYENSIYSFEQFDLIYNRPDIVFANLEGIIPDKTIDNYYRAYQKRLAKLNINEEDLKLSKDIPNCVFETKELDGNGNYALHLKIENQSRNINFIHLLVNGVPEHGAKGLSVSKNIQDTTLQLRLEPGNNRIEVFVTNENGINSLKNIELVAVPDYSFKKNLYLVTLGASQFKEDQFNLKYASKDALDVADYFKTVKAYDSVFVLTLTNEKVTQGAVTSILKFYEKAKEQDVVLLYAAGHGVLSAELDFYFATYDMEFLYPEKRGIKYDDLENVLEKCKSRHKSLFLDACHSGEIDKDEAELELALQTEVGDVQFRNVGNSIDKKSQGAFELSKAIFADMSTNHGISIVSSAGGAEFAMEGKEWNNGVFTYAFLNGLKSNEADANKDKKVSLSEIKNYVFQQVLELTSGRQSPTLRTENLYNDFTIN